MTKRGALLCGLCLAAGTSSTHVGAFSSIATRPVGLRRAPTKTASVVPSRFLQLQMAEVHDDDAKCNVDKFHENETALDDNNKEKKSMNPTPVLYSAVAKLFDSKTDKSTTTLTAATAGAALAMLLMFATPDAAMAAMSGGRMGGSFSAPRSSMPSSSRGYSSGGYSSRGYYSGGPRVTVAPVITPYAASITPFFNPFPRPYYYGGGPSVVAVSRGPSLFDLMFLGAVGFVIVNTIRGFGEASTAGGPGFWSDNVSSDMTALGPGTTVAQISVAMQVPNRDDPNSILNVLNRLSQTARTDSRVGVQQLTSQVALEVLRRKSSIVSAATRSKHFGGGSNNNKAQRDFNSRAVQERGKFESETVSKYGGVDYVGSSSSSSYSGGASSSDDDKATMAVITIVMAIGGDSTKLNTVRSIRDVEDALRKIAADSKVDDCLQSAEILWTPTDRRESLTPRDVVADYPELRTV